MTAPGYTRVSGTVKVKVGTSIYTAKLANSSTRKVTITLPKLKKGTYTVVASFVPTGTTAAGTTSSVSKKATLRVV